MRATAKRARGRDGRMLAARVEPKNGSRSQEIKSPLTTKAPYKRGWETERWLFGPKLPRPSSTLPSRRALVGSCPPDLIADSSASRRMTPSRYKHHLRATLG